MPFVNDGYTYLLEAAFRAGTQFATTYVGLASGTLTSTSVLADISGEPPLVNGYARIPLTSDLTGWPTIIWARPSPIDGASWKSLPEKPETT